MTPTLPDRLRADADLNTVSGDSGFSNEVMRDLQYTAGLEREASDELQRQAEELAEVRKSLNDGIFQIAAALGMEFEFGSADERIRAICGEIRALSKGKS